MRPRRGNRKIQQISVKGIIARDNKVLVLKTAGRGNYELPGGRMDFGETVEQALKREMKEELGWNDITIGDMINVWTFRDTRRRVDYHFVILDFEIFSRDREIKISPEHTQYKWIGPEDLESLDMREGHKRSLKKYFKK